MRFLDAVSWVLLACGAALYVTGLISASPRGSNGVSLVAAVIIVLILAPYVRPGAQRRTRRRKGCCPFCGYDLRYRFSAGCPECGWRRIDPTPRT